GKLLHLPLQDRRPMIELCRVRVRQRILVLGLGQAPTDRYVLSRLHEEVRTDYLRHFGTQALDYLLCRYFALRERLELDEQPGRVLGGVATGRAGEADDALDCGVGQNDPGKLVLELGNRGERSVLACFGLAEDETRILLRKEALGYVNIEDAGHHDQH